LRAQAWLASIGSGLLEFCPAFWTSGIGGGRGRLVGLLDDKVCLVTGAGQGLGRAVSLEMAAEGATVVLLERNPETLAAVTAEIEATGQKAFPYQLDITDYHRYREIVADVASTHGRIDVLVNNAAINPPTRTILTDTLEEWRRTITINLEAVYMGSKLVAPHMVEQRDGRIIHIASIQGFASSGETGSYNAAKGAIIAYTKSMAVELAPYNILVNAVAPGFMATPMAVVNGVDEASTPDFLEWYVGRRKIPLARTGYPEDVSGTVIFLASSYCRYMTGQLLVVDGGLMSTI
jgi:NAD(P)-dependent dehydrogenase (short-subunit alcohol dehydrogenase family)